ncbi:MAG: hypothetical protein ACK2T3_09600 [Candidatus Promineifilaceae bacterium]|jgi:hypothetical protein
MAAANGELVNILPLSAEERAFLRETLRHVQLSGTPESLRRALKLIDGIQEKLEEDFEGSAGSEN